MSFIGKRVAADPRRFLRYPVDIVCDLSGPGGIELAVRVLEISGGGARARLPAELRGAFEGPGWLLTVPRLGCYEGARAWREGGLVGITWVMDEREQDHLARRLVEILRPER